LTYPGEKIVHQLANTTAFPKKSASLGTTDVAYSDVGVDVSTEPASGELPRSEAWCATPMEVFSQIENLQTFPWGKRRTAGLPNEDSGDAWPVLKSMEVVPMLYS
jgi:hypothetical protein